MKRTQLPGRNGKINFEVNRSFLKDSSGKDFSLAEIIIEIQRIISANLVSIRSVTDHAVVAKLADEVACCSEMLFAIYSTGAEFVIKDSSEKRIITDENSRGFEIYLNQALLSGSKLAQERIKKTALEIISRTPFSNDDLAEIKKLCSKYNIAHVVVDYFLQNKTSDECIAFCDDMIKSIKDPVDLKDIAALYWAKGIACEKAGKEGALEAFRESYRNQGVLGGIKLYEYCKKGAQNQQSPLEILFELEKLCITQAQPSSSSLIKIRKKIAQHYHFGDGVKIDKAKASAYYLMAVKSCAQGVSSFDTHSSYYNYLILFVEENKKSGSKVIDERQKYYEYVAGEMNYIFLRLIDKGEGEDLSKRKDLIVKCLKFLIEYHQNRGEQKEFVKYCAVASNFDGKIAADFATWFDNGNAELGLVENKETALSYYIKAATNYQRQKDSDSFEAAKLCIAELLAQGFYPSADFEKTDVARCYHSLAALNIDADVLSEFCTKYKYDPNAVQHKASNLEGERPSTVVSAAKDMNYFSSSMEEFRKKEIELSAIKDEVEQKEKRQEIIDFLAKSLFDRPKKKAVHKEESQKESLKAAISKYLSLKFIPQYKALTENEVLRRLRDNQLETSSIILSREEEMRREVEMAKIKAATEDLRLQKERIIAEAKKAEEKIAADEKLEAEKQVKILQNKKREAEARAAEQLQESLRIKAAELKRLESQRKILEESAAGAKAAELALAQVLKIAAQKEESEKKMREEIAQKAKVEQEMQKEIAALQAHETAKNNVIEILDSIINSAASAAQHDMSAKDISNIATSINQAEENLRRTIREEKQKIVNQLAFLIAEIEDGNVDLLLKAKENIASYIRQGFAPNDPSRTLEQWLEILSKHKIPEAQHHLFWVKKDNFAADKYNSLEYDEVVKPLSEAAMAGYPPAIFDFAEVLTKDKTRAVFRSFLPENPCHRSQYILELYQGAASAGDDRALLKLAQIHNSGFFEIATKNPPAAIKYVSDFSRIRGGQMSKQEWSTLLKIIVQNFDEAFRNPSWMLNLPYQMQVDIAQNIADSTSPAEDSGQNYQATLTDCDSCVNCAFYLDHLWRGLNFNLHKDDRLGKENAAQEISAAIIAVKRNLNFQMEKADKAEAAYSLARPKKTHEQLIKDAKSYLYWAQEGIAISQYYCYKLYCGGNAELGVEKNPKLAAEYLQKLCANDNGSEDLRLRGLYILNMIMEAAKSQKAPQQLSLQEQDLKEVAKFLPHNIAASASPGSVVAGAKAGHTNVNLNMENGDTRC